MQTLPSVGPADRLVVTRNNRLARQLTNAVAAAELAAGRDVWSTPRIVPFSAFVQDLFVDVAAKADEMLLNETQARELWRQAAPPLPSLAATVREAVYESSYDSLVEARRFGIDTDVLRTSARTPEQRWFVRTVGDYTERLAAERLVDGRLVTERIVAADRRPAATPIEFAGFLDPAPQERELVDWLRRGRVDASFRESAAGAGPVPRYEFDTIEQELTAAGQWARQCLIDEPNRRVAVVVPGLANAAERYAGLVLDGLAPHWQSRGDRGLVNVSIGRTLDRYPLIASWLNLIGGCRQPFDAVAASALLTDPLVAREAGGPFADLEQRLCREPEQSYSFSTLRDYHGGRLGDHGRRRLEELAAIERGCEEWIETNTAEWWAEQLYATIAAVCDLPDPDSERWQLHVALREALNRIGALGKVRGRLTGWDAFETLKRELSRTVFQTQDTTSRVDLMGPLEAIGGGAGAVWFAGLDAGRWPPARMASPYIAMALQRAKGMPAADAEGHRRWTGLVLRDVLGHGQTAAVSSSRLDGDAPLLPASAISDWPLDAFSDAAPTRPAAGLAGEPCELLADAAVPVTRPAGFRGGFGLIERQRSAPLLALLEYRLGARELERPTTGFGAANRGTLIHAALEHLLRDTISEDGTDQRELAVAVAERVARRLRRRNQPKLNRLIDREVARCASLLRRMIEVDSSRPTFTTESRELALTLEVDGLSLALKIDRVDCIGESRLIVDYKTGAQPRALLTTQRLPGDFQLLVYATALTDARPALALCGLAIAQVHTSAVGYRGLWLAPEDPGFGRFERRYTAADLTDGTERVRRLVREFAAGNPIVAQPMAVGELTGWWPVIGELVVPSDV